MTIDHYDTLSVFDFTLYLLLGELSSSSSSTSTLKYLRFYAYFFAAVFEAQLIPDVCHSCPHSSSQRALSNRIMS